MTNEQIAELRKLLTDASPGPWKHTEGWEFISCKRGYDVAEEVRPKNAALIVALRNNAADMLDEIERLRAASDI